MKYIIICIFDGENPNYLKWRVADEEKILLFNSKSSAHRFLKQLFNETGFLNYQDLDFCDIIEAPDNLDNCLNATNLIPVPNGDDIELKEVVS